MLIKRLLENRGWEVTVSSRRNTRDFRYKIRGNFFQLVLTLFRIIVIGNK